MTQDATGAGRTGDDLWNRPVGDAWNAIFARRLREIRTQAGVTQQQLVDRLNQYQIGKAPRMHRSAIAKIESGERPVSVGEAMELAEALGTTIRYLLFDNRRKSSQERQYQRYIDARMQVRSLQYEYKQRQEHLTECEALFADVQARLMEAQERLDMMSQAVGLDPDDPAHVTKIERLMAERSGRPLNPEDE